MISLDTYNILLRKGFSYQDQCIFFSFVIVWSKNIFVKQKSFRYLPIREKDMNC
jgi:hypothetical protein